MAFSFFNDKSKVPDNSDLQQALENTKKLWDELKAYIKDNYDSIREEWKHYGKKSGWTMKLLSKKRNMMFLWPLKGHFIVVFILGEKAVKAAMDSSLDESIITKIKEAKPYMEGRGIRVEVTSEKDIDNIKKLVEIKMNY